MAENRHGKPGDGHDDRSGVRLSGKQIGTGIVVLLLVVFVLQNTDTTSITLLLFDVSVPLWLVLSGTILLSMGVGYALGSRGRSRRT